VANGDQGNVGSEILEIIHSQRQKGTWKIGLKVVYLEFPQKVCVTVITY